MLYVYFVRLGSFRESDNGKALQKIWSSHGFAKKFGEKGFSFSLNLHKLIVYPLVEILPCYSDYALNLSTITLYLKYKRTGQVSFGGWSLLPKYLFPLLARKSSGFAQILPFFCPKMAIWKILRGLQPLLAPWPVRLWSKGNKSLLVHVLVKNKTN